MTPKLSVKQQALIDGMKAGELLFRSCSRKETQAHRVCTHSLGGVPVLQTVVEALVIRELIAINEAEIKETAGNGYVNVDYPYELTAAGREA